MKKYDKYYPAAVAVRKKKIRKKPSFSFLKPIFLFCLFVVFCLGAYWTAKRAYQAFSDSQLGVWAPKAVSVSGADSRLAAELQLAAQAKLNQPFSVKDAVYLQRQLVKKYPQLQYIRVKRGLMSRKLKISVKPRVPMAQFHLSDASVHYIDQDGNIYENLTPDKQAKIPTVELEGQIPVQLNQELVGLLESTLKLKNQLDYSSLQFNLVNNTVKMQLPDGCEIDFGPATQLRQKAKRAAQIELLAEDTQPHPHILDFTYFEEGKVFLRQKAR